MNKGLFGSYFEEYFLCFLCFQNTKNLLSEKGPILCVLRVSKTLGLFDSCFLKLFFLKKIRRTKKIGKGFWFSFSFLFF